VDRHRVADRLLVAVAGAGMTAAGAAPGPGLGVWPGGKRCAVAITVRVDGPLFWLRFSPASRDRPKTLSIGEYGLRRGAPRVLALLDHLGLPATWLIPGTIATAEPELCRAVVELGHEIAHRGQALEDFARLTADQQRGVLLAATEAIFAATGTPPDGFSAPPGDVTTDTFALLAELGYTWCSVLHGDDQPSFIAAGGPGPLVHLPNRWELQDAPYFVFNYEPAYPPGQGRIASYDEVLDSWRAEFDGYRAHGGCLVLGLDAQSIGTPGKTDMLAELLSHVTRTGEAWVATCADIATWWARQHPGHPPDESERIRRGLRQEVALGRWVLSLMPMASRRPTFPQR
jgi:peptidoglycan/xylan/chitin deacetylase (PgdA/CDA1 family)